MRIVLATTVLLALAAACSSGSTQDDGQRPCQDLAAKLAQCKLSAQGTCNSNEPCAVECAARADCAQLTAAMPTGSYLACIAACSGAGPDDFICRDGKGFLNKAAVCDGRAQCPDGSDEADCGKDGGGGGAAGLGSGGIGASGGAGGVPQGGGGTVTDSGASGSAGASPECQAMVEHELSTCPNLSRDGELQSCEQGTLLYAPEGCGQAWNNYLACETKAPVDCQQGPTGCDAEQTAYFSCQSQFTSKTGCSRGGADDKCPSTAPYIYGCIGSVPGGCIQLPPTGRATQVCCPQFPPQ